MASSSPATLDASLFDPVRATRIYPELVLLSNALLLTQIQSSTRAEMATLAGELRDEWKVRVGALKADWMARWIPDERHEDGAQVDAEPDADANTGEPELRQRIKMNPTVVSDVDETEAMSKRVDQGVEDEFNERIAEAERRVKSAVQGREVLSVEVMVGECLFEAQADEQSLDETAITLHETLVEVLAKHGIDAGVLIRTMRRGNERLGAISSSDAANVELLTQVLGTSGIRDQDAMEIGEGRYHKAPEGRNAMPQGANGGDDPFEDAS
ncbi:BQ5605_C008g05006 [Microbotryum silenes-dioicae]|uniref:BQ5605_C008g05006 protein n=1 Tax=Microbotryum silenes-dioicae TaxID=796604 RepID=A0A2X0MBR5_9BASI|nr:BQ5605_C008g05006 [Microbotryum silenes-dioicae]